MKETVGNMKLIEWRMLRAPIEAVPGCARVGLRILPSVVCNSQLASRVKSMRTHIKPLIALCSLCALGASAAEKPSLDEHLEPFRSVLGKTWKGHFKNSTPERPQVDVARWERALNGKAIRILH